LPSSRASRVGGAFGQELILDSSPFFFIAPQGYRDPSELAAKQMARRAAQNRLASRVQLLELKSLLDKGLITQEEYDQKRMTILNSL
jgi:hypothetical protein